MRGRGEGRGGNKKGEKRRRPQKLVHTRRNLEKYPAWKTDVIAGGGNTDLCPPGGKHPRAATESTACVVQLGAVAD